MAFNTGNPIGSTDARDLSDNAENFDKALGTLDATWTDRLGVTRDSFEGRLAKGSFYRVGTFSAGYTLTNMRQTLEYSGHEYSWSGAFPKVVAAGATPATTGGIGAGAWVDRTDVTLRSDLASESGSALVGYQPAGTGAVATTVQRKLREWVTPKDFGAHSIDEPGYATFDSTSAIVAAIAANKRVWFPTGQVFNVTVAGIATEGVVLASDGTGGLQQINGSQGTIYIAAKNVKISGLYLRGKKAALNYSASDVGIVIDSSGVTVENCDIAYFAGAGVSLVNNYVTPPVPPTSWPTVVRNNVIRDCSTGVLQDSDYEYASIEGNRITRCGFNNAFTNWALDHRNGGYYGRLSNTAIINNQFLDNAQGVFVRSTDGSNPDHNKIVGNTINHNRATGLLIEAVKNYVMVADNIILSNVLDAAAPSIVFAPTGSNHDLVLVDVVGCVFTGNAIGTGSYADYIPIFGHARCRYIGNNFLWGVPKEMRVPVAGTALRDSYGYTVNGDNQFINNLYFHTISKPSLLPSTIYTINKDNIEYYGGGQHNLDCVLKTPTMNANWSGQYTGYEPLRYWRENGNVVHVVGTIANNGSGGSIAFNLPDGYRPANMVDSVLINGVSGALSFGRLYSNGDFQPVAISNNVPVSVNFAFNV